MKCEVLSWKRTSPSPVSCVYAEVGSSQISGGDPHWHGVPRHPLCPLEKTRLHAHLQLPVLLQACSHKHPAVREGRRAVGTDCRAEPAHLSRCSAQSEHIAATESSTQSLSSCCSPTGPRLRRQHTVTLDMFQKATLPTTLSLTYPLIGPEWTQTQ